MSETYPKLNAKELIKILEGKGFVFSRQNGSHAIFIHENGKRTTVPIHGKKTIGIGLLRQIMKDAGLSLEHIKK
jgi:predicted RNA binding protein YcfA (HicA-like mRNA interferase family)